MKGHDDMGTTRRFHVAHFRGHLNDTPSTKSDPRAALAVARRSSGLRIDSGFVPIASMVIGLSGLRRSDEKNHHRGGGRDPIDGPAPTLFAALGQSQSGGKVKVVIAGTNDKFDVTDGSLAGTGTFKATGAITDKGIGPRLPDGEG